MVCGSAFSRALRVLLTDELVTDVVQQSRKRTGDRGVEHVELNVWIQLEGKVFSTGDRLFQLRVRL